MFQRLLVFWGVIFSIVTPFIGLILVDREGALQLTTVLPFLTANAVGLLLTVLSECLSCVVMFYCMDKRFKEMGYATHRMPQ